MYESFYELREKPFSLLPDPSFLYLSPQHSAAYSLLEYGVLSHAGFIVITGEVGCGKTTLLRHLLTRLSLEVTVGLISNTAKARDHLLKWALLAFGQDYKRQDPVELHESLESFLIDEYAAGRRVVLIVDEAQNLPTDTLEELRMLSNINADKDQVLQLILAGQPELKETLGLPELRQLAQRIVVSYHLCPLSPDDTRGYIRHRLAHAGGRSELFTDQAIELVHEQTGGIPRLINGLCDMALVYGYGEGAWEIDERILQAVISDQTGHMPHRQESDLVKLRQAEAVSDYPEVATVDRNLVREVFRQLKKK